MLLLSLVSSGSPSGHYWCCKKKSSSVREFSPLTSTALNTSGWKQGQTAHFLLGFFIQRDHTFTQPWNPRKVIWNLWPHYDVTSMSRAGKALLHIISEPQTQEVKAKARKLFWCMSQQRNSHRTNLGPSLCRVSGSIYTSIDAMSNLWSIFFSFWWSRTPNKKKARTGKLPCLTSADNFYRRAEDKKTQ